MPTICPECGSAELHLIEVRGSYDGVLIVECIACGHLWPRFPDTPTDAHLHHRALKIIDIWKRGGVNV